MFWGYFLFLGVFFQVKHYFLLWNIIVRLDVSEDIIQ